MIYTVIGSYTDGLKYLGHMDAETPQEALRKVAIVHEGESLAIAAVIEGHHVDESGGDYVDDIADCLEEL